MPRAAAFTVENNFRNGLITEASGLNFPEAACTETWNCVFEFDGSVHRRLGVDYETQYTQKTINRTNSVVKSYLWKNVAGDGGTTLLVLQVGATLYFYKTNLASISLGAVVSTVALTSFDASGAPSTATTECQFSSGNGLLFVTHPYCDPFYVSYNTSTDTATGTAITLKIRDFEGVSDGLAVDGRPTANMAGITAAHHYNLLNQGWTATTLAAWDTAQATLPSNADVPWTFKDSSGNFDAGNSAIARVYRGNTPAPKGHYVLSLHNQDRDTASGLSGVTATTTSYQRASTSAFFAGRVFYAGINYIGFNSKIYFTQIVERTEQYGFCYQQSDPTSEDVFDLLPSDGGVISIPEAGTIYKLFTVVGGLAVFAQNGVWFISGSTGLGFTANDYVVQKLSSYSTLSAVSFVDVGGAPAWWTTEGIYILSSDGQNPQIQSLSDAKIRSFYDAIPTASKRNARGGYNPSEGVIRWAYRSEVNEDVTDAYEYDRILNFNVQTGAFYPWAFETADVKINGLFATELDTGAVTENQVVSNGGVDTVQDGSGNNVVTFTSAQPTITADFRYIVSIDDGAGSYDFTFGQDKDTGYVDWATDDETAFSSYFVTGYKVRGDAIKKTQPTWTRLYSQSGTSYVLSGVWDYSTLTTTNRWSSPQTITHPAADYSFVSTRRKIRGHGIALQLRVDSVATEPFWLIGWSMLDTGNQMP
jgi:hypothetical protein